MTQQDLEKQEQAARIRRRVFQIEQLSAMPQVASQLLAALQDEMVEVAEVVGIIESDPALASRLLSLANSAYYGFAQQISTVRRAVVAIGFEELRYLSMSVGLADMFDPARAPKSLDASALWAHCVAVSWLAREMAEKARFPAPGEVMVAGLLHDLGKLVLATYFTADFERLVRLTESGTPYYQAEDELGLEHTVVGHWLARRWNLPAVLSVTVRDHHNTGPDPEFSQAVCLVQAADEAAKELGFGLDQEAYPLDRAKYLARAGLSAQTALAVQKEGEKRIPALLEYWRDGLA